MSLKKIITSTILSLVALGGFFGVVEYRGTYTSMTVAGTYAQDINQSAAETARLNAQAGNAGATKSNDATASQKLSNKYNDFIEYINIALATLTAMISPLILFVGWLMSPDWTAGDLFGLRVPMYNLWVIVSNIVYFVYAVLLILIALGTMFNQDKFSYKVMLPKLALGIIMVPFTWWFVQWTISIASVVTASTISIPAETMASLNAKSPSKWFSGKPSIPKEIIIDARGGTGANQDLGSTLTSCEKDESKCVTPEKFLSSGGGMYGPLVVYAYSIFRFHEIKSLRVDGPAGVAVDVVHMAMKIVHDGLVSAIMFFIFGILTLALVVILLVRAVKLWVYAIFSPLFTFRFVAGSNLIGGDENDSFTIKEFVGLAFVPAIIGLALSFGLIMVAAVQSGGMGSSTGSATLENGKCDPSTEKGCVLTNILGSPKNSISRWNNNKDPKNVFTETTFEWGELKVKYWGKGVIQPTTSSSSSAVDVSSGVFGTLIIDVIALVFIWMAFMAAKNVSKAVKAVAQPFEEMGNKIGGLAKSLPKYAPLPLPGGSIAGMGKVADGLSRIPEYRSQERFDKSDLGKWIKEQTGQAGSAEKYAETVRQMKDLKTVTKEGFQSNIRQYTAADNNDLIKALSQEKDTSVLIKRLESMSFTPSESKTLIDAAFKDGATTADKLKLQLALQEGKTSDWTTKQSANESALKSYIDGNNKSQTQQSQASQQPTPTTINLNIANKGEVSIPQPNLDSNGTILNAGAIADAIKAGYKQGEQLDKDKVRTELDKILRTGAVQAIMNNLN